MHAYLIIGTTDQIKLERAQSIAKKSGARLIPQTLQKIEDVRNLHKIIRLTPIEPTAIYISDIDLATPETVNAFLKSLEEKENYLFILTATTKARVLPTIISRCVVIETRNPDLTQLELDLAKDFFKMSTAERLVYIESFKGRSEAESFVDSILIGGERLLKTDKNSLSIAQILSHFLTLRPRFRANTNPLLQLTNLVLCLDGV